MKSKSPHENNNKPDFKKESYVDLPLALDQRATQELLKKQNSYDRTIKRTADIIFAALVLIFGAPLFLLIAVLVKLSSHGPVFYLQQRVGRNYIYFGCIKFRTMHSEADSMLEKLLERDLSLKSEFEKDFKLRNDPRITPIGSLLRRSSLDELPQFINILRGDMSLVGPRPIVEKEIQKYGDFMDLVVSVRPGLTGLWQVSGRNKIKDFDKWVQLDLEYIDNWSFMLDVKIAFKTVRTVLSGTGV